MEANFVSMTKEDLDNLFQAQMNTQKIQTAVQNLQTQQRQLEILKKHVSH